jgi:hypothetical protein
MLFVLKDCVFKPSMSNAWKRGALAGKRCWRPPVERLEILRSAVIATIER